MEKLFEKKNLGIPVTILVLMAYFIGYYLTLDYSGLLVGVLFAFLVFSLDFDERVRTAVKQSYILSLLFSLIYLAFDLLYNFWDLITPQDFSTFFVQTALYEIHRYGLNLFKMAIIFIFLLFILAALMKKEIKLGFIANILGEGPTKKATPIHTAKPPMYQQPMPQPAPHPMSQPIPQPMSQPVPQPIPQPMQQSVPQPAPLPIPQPAPQQVQQPIPQSVPQPAPGTAPKGIICAQCGVANQPEAAFCANCGTKLT